MKQIIKLLYLLVFCSFLGTKLYSQAPQKFNYQGIARDAKGNPMAKQQLALKLTVLPAPDAILPEYEETQLVTTNEFGLYTLQIGNGIALTGDMKTVKWETGNKYIKVSIDPKGGNNYVDAGTSQLLSVPYALYADKSGETKVGVSDKPTRATNNYIEKTNGAGVANSNSLLFDNGTNIGMGTTSPQAKIHMNAATTNELRIQSAGGSPRLSFFGDNATTFTSTANYALMYKRPATDVGNYSTGFPNAKLFIFGNAQGGLLFNTGGNVGFGYFNQTANTTTTNLFVEGTTGNTGIGTASPGAKLEVAGQIKITGGTPGLGKVLTSDANGLASWQTPSGGSGGTQWTTSGNNIYNNNTANVGIGITIPTSKLHVRDATTTLTSGIIRGEYAGPNVNSDIVGIYGKSLANTNYGIGVIGEGNYRGLLGLSTSGIGVYASSTNGSALYASSQKGNAIRATSDSMTSGYFTSNASSGTALYDGVLRGEYTGTLADQIVGVYGKSVISGSTGLTGIGVQGVGGDIGVNAQSSGASGYGIYGTGGFTGTGAYGYSFSGIGTSGQSYNGVGVDAFSIYYHGINAKSLNGIGVNSSADSNSAGYFSAGDATASPALTTNGVLKGEYVGAFGEDCIGVYGVSLAPTTSVQNGIGVRGRGNYIGVNGVSNGTLTNSYAGYFSGALYATSASFGTKAFKIDHPQDPANKFLYHSCVESNDMMNIYNGNITTDANGDAVVNLPSYFEALNIDFKYQLTVIGTFAQAIISEEVANNQFKIKTNQGNVKVSWQVTGVRNDAMAQAHRIEVEVVKTGKDQGKYLNPIEAGRPLSEGIMVYEKVESNKVDLENMSQQKSAHQKRIDRMKKNDEKNEKLKSTSTTSNEMSDLRR